MRSVSSSSCATLCLRRFHVRILFVSMWKCDVGICTDIFIWCPVSVKPSPSKKSRGGGQGGLRRAPTLGAPTPLSHATTQPAVDSRAVYHSPFKSTDAEADSSKKRCVTCNLIWYCLHQCYSKIKSLFSGVLSGRPDLVPKTPPLPDNPADCEANLSTSSLGSTGAPSSSPPLR